MFESLKELFHYRSMIHNLVKREVRGRYKGSVLGALWNFVLPLVQIIVFIVVFTQIFRSGIENYAIYLIAGLLFWNWFQESMSEGQGTIVQNGDMVKKIYFPRSAFPITVSLSKMVNYFIMMGIFFVVVVYLGHPINPWALLFLPIITILSLIFITGLQLFLSSIDVFFRDVQYIVSVFLMAWIWMTPIMYSTTTIDSELILTFLSLNPITYFVNVFHDILYWGVIPSMVDLAVCAGLQILTSVIGWVVFNHLEKNFAEVL